MATMDSAFHFFDKVKDMGPIQSAMVKIEIIQPKFGYGIPDKPSIKELLEECQTRNIRNILSIGSGIGYVEYLIKTMGGLNVIATDPFTSHDTHKYIENRWCEIEKLDHKDAIDTYGTNVDCLLMVWPAMDKWSYETVKIARDKNIKYIIYIGETSNCPCTGTDEMLDELETYWEDEIQIYYKTFKSINDSINLYSLKL